MHWRPLEWLLFYISFQEFVGDSRASQVDGNLYNANLYKTYQMAEYFQSIRLDLDVFRSAKSIKNDHFLQDDVHFIASEIGTNSEIPNDRPYQIEDFFKKENSLDVVNKLNFNRHEKFEQIFAYEDRVLADFKRTMPTDTQRRSIEDSREYIKMLETYCNAQTLFNNQCRHMVRGLLGAYNTSRLDLCSLIEKIILNEN